MDTHKLSKFSFSHVGFWLELFLDVEVKAKHRNYFPIASRVFLAVIDYCWRQQLLPGTAAVLCQHCAHFYHFYFIVLLVFTLLKVSFDASYFHNKSLTVIKMLRQFLHELLTVSVVWHLMCFRGCTRTKRIHFGTWFPISCPLCDRRRQEWEMGVGWGGWGGGEGKEGGRKSSQQMLNLDGKTNIFIPKKVTNYSVQKYRSSNSPPCPYSLTYSVSWVLDSERKQE